MNDQPGSQLLRAHTEHRSEPAFAEPVRRHLDFVYSAVPVASENPNGIPPRSPGLRGTSYPGKPRPNGANPNGAASGLNDDQALPRWVGVSGTVFPDFGLRIDVWLDSAQRWRHRLNFRVPKTSAEL